MKKVFIFLILAMCTANAFAQEHCYFPTGKGAELTYKYYNQRGKPLKDQWGDVRWMRFVVEDVWVNDSGMIINVAIGNETIDRLAKCERTKKAAESLSYGDVKIEGGHVTLDNIQWLAEIIPSSMYDVLSDRNDGDDSKYGLELSALSSFPRRMEVGDMLPDEKILDSYFCEILTEEEKARRDKLDKEIELEFTSMTGVGMGNLDANAQFKRKASTRNRKVEAYEKVTTPAGTFDCYKITYELVLPIQYNFSIGLTPIVANGVLQPIIVPYADWISPQVGLVRREKYNDRGKVLEYMQLESYKK